MFKTLLSLVSRCSVFIKEVFLTDIIPTKYLPMTQLIILINIIVFTLQVLNPVVTETYVFRSDIWYSYITACFLHGGLGHLAGNLLFFSFIVPVIERRYGSSFLFFSYIFTGIMGNLLFALFMPDVLALGASGSICGLMMLWIFHNLLEWRPLLILAALFYFCKQGIMSGIDQVFPSGIGHLAHYGAALGSFFLLPYMVYKRKQ